MGIEAIGIVIFIVLAVVCLKLIDMQRYTIYEYERGLLYIRGRFHRILDPGRYWFFHLTHTVRKVDIRTQFVSIVGQEVLSADNVSIKMSLVASYKISDPHLAVNQTANYQQALYLLLQLCLRDLIGSTPIDELLSKREEIGQQMYEKAVDQVAELGVELSLVGIKDVMFPGDLKAIFAQVVNARKEGLAALERARGETAALRNLANAAKMLENNPALMQLRLLQAIGDQPGNTVILTSNLDDPVHLKLLQERTAKSQKE